MGEHSSDKSSIHQQATFDNQLALTLESILDGFFACDSDWRVVYLNSTAESVFGIPREEALGKSFWELFPATLGIKYEQELRSAAAGEIRDFEYFYQPWGRWYHNRCFPRKGGGISSYFQDITDKKRIEEALLESEQRLNFYVDHSPLASIEWDSNFIVTRWAGEAEKMFGWTRAETLGKPIMDLHMIYEEDIHLVEGTMANLTAGRANHIISSNRNYTKDGRVIFCEWYNTLITDQQGRLVSVLSQVMDVTERRKLEEKLRASEEKYRSLVEATSDCIWEVDQNGRFTYVSPKIRDMIGYAPEECLGRCPLDFAPEDEAVHAREQTRTSLMAQKECISQEYKVRHRNGRLVVVEVSGVPLFGPDGEFLGMRGITRDISGRKKAEEKVLQSRRLLDATEKISKSGGWEWDLESQAMMWTDQTYRIHGFTPGEIPSGSQFFIERSLACYDPQDRLVIMEAFNRCVEHGQPYNLEFPFTTVDGRRIWIQTTGQAVMDGKRVIKVLGNIFDITERKEAEIALQASLAEKDVLLREVHHRVKNNLASIVGLMEMQLEGTNDKAVMDAFKEIDDRIMSIALIHERLYQSEYMDRIDIEEYLHDLTTHLLGCYGAYSLISFLVTAEHAEISLDIAIPIGLIVNELVTNSIKYAFPEGKPRAGHNKCEIRISLQKIDDSFHLSVADNGTGLPPDLDWRAVSSLGLRLVSLLGEQQLKGQIQLDLSEGTRFMLMFPDRKK